MRSATREINSKWASVQTELNNSRLKSLQYEQNLEKLNEIIGEKQSLEDELSKVKSELNTFRIKQSKDVLNRKRINEVLESSNRQIAKEYDAIRGRMRGFRLQLQKFKQELQQIGSSVRGFVDVYCTLSRRARSLLSSFQIAVPSRLNFAKGEALYSNDLDHIRTENQRLLTLNRELKSQFGDFRSSPNPVVSKSSGPSCNKLQERIVQLENTLYSKDEEILKFSNKLKKKCDLLETSELQNARLSARVAMLERSSAESDVSFSLTEGLAAAGQSLQSEIARNTKREAELLSEIHLAKNAWEKASLNNEKTSQLLREKEMIVKGISIKLERAEEELSDLRKELGKRNEEIAQLSQIMRESEENAVVIKTLSATVADLSAKLKPNEESLNFTESLGVKVGELKSVKEAVRELEENLKATIKRFSEQREWLTGRIREQKAEFEMQKSELEGVISVLTGKLKQKVEKNVIPRVEDDGLQQQISALVSQAEQRESLLKAKNEEIERLRDELRDKISPEVESLKSPIAKLKDGDPEPDTYVQREGKNSGLGKKSAETEKLHKTCGGSKSPRLWSEKSEVNSEIVRQNEEIIWLTSRNAELLKLVRVLQGKLQDYEAKEGELKSEIDYESLRKGIVMVHREVSGRGNGRDVSEIFSGLFRMMHLPDLKIECRLKMERKFETVRHLDFVLWPWKGKT
jgi:chromosome segregation ATPase